MERVEELRGTLILEDGEQTITFAVGGPSIDDDLHRLGTGPAETAAGIDGRRRQPFDSDGVLLCLNPGEAQHAMAPATTSHPRRRNDRCIRSPVRELVAAELCKAY